MFHVVGSTPEAPTLDDALQHRAPERVELISLASLRAARDELISHAGEGLASVSLGTPHASLAELERLAAMLGHRRVHPDVECVVSTARDVLALAEESGSAARLREAGVALLTDTCSYVAPILRNPAGPVMTDSAKWAYYAPGTIGASVVFGSTADCIESAVVGRIVRDLAPWGGA